MIGLEPEPLLRAAAGEKEAQALRLGGGKEPKELSFLIVTSWAQGPWLGFAAPAGGQQEHWPPLGLGLGSASALPCPLRPGHRALLGLCWAEPF
jgi:hypothetical protein